MRRLTNYVLAALLLFLYTTRLWVAALGKSLWTDESVGIWGSVYNSFSRLILQGPAGEASPSPLPYLVEKSWLAYWNYQPQLWWNTRMFFRLLPVTYWALAAVIVFIFFTIFFPRFFPLLHWGWITLLSLAISLFYHSGSFAQYYALEDRTYAPWLLMSTIHFLFFLVSCARELSKKEWFAYTFVCVLMVATTYVTLAQIAIGFFVHFIFFRNPQKNILQHLKFYGVIFAAPTILAFYYFFHVIQYHYIPPPWWMFHEAVMEVVSKAFHHHGIQQLFFTIPLFAMLAPYLLRAQKATAAISVFFWLHIFLSGVFFVGCLVKGNLFHSRYFIFLTPASAAMYGVGILFVANTLGKISTRIKGTHIILFWAGLTVLTQLPIYVKAVYKDWPLFAEKKAYKKTTNPKCDEKLITGDFQKMEEQNRICRTF